MGAKRRVSLKVINVDRGHEKALVESITHWVRMRQGISAMYESPSGDYCACCSASTGFCTNCPVAEMTGKEGCRGTPWRRAADAFSESPHSLNFREAAADELEFLRSCLAWVRAGKPTDAA